MRLFGWGKPEKDAPAARSVPLFPSMGRFGRRSMMTAAMPDRLNSAWVTVPIPADDIVRRHQRILVARSREQARNNDYAASFLRMVAQNVIGPQGIRLQSQARSADGRTLDTAANDAVEAGWGAWGAAENCDVAGRQSWRQIQKQCATTQARDGEYFLRMVYGRDAGPWGFALQAIDPQRCPVDYDVGPAPDGTFVRHGIKFNKYGRPLGYFFSTTDEGTADYFYGGRALMFVSADEIIHGYRIDIVGQKRGLPWMATAMWRLNMLGGYEQAALTNAQIAAKQSGFFTWKEGYGTELDDDEEITMEVEAGVWRELPEGAEVVPVQPQYPVGELQPFRKEMLRAAAAGLGVAYNNFAQDLEGVNYSSIRQGTLDEREGWKEVQEDLIDDLHRRVFAAWLPVALLAGRIVTTDGKRLPAADLTRLNAPSWQPRRWQWVDPNSDVKAAVEMKNNMMGSFSQYIRDQGRDPQTVWREIAADIEGMRAAGIPEEYIKQIFAKSGAAGKIPPQSSDSGDGAASGNTDPPGDGA